MEYHNSPLVSHTTMHHTSSTTYVPRFIKIRWPLQNSFPKGGSPWSHDDKYRKSVRLQSTAIVRKRGLVGRYRITNIYNFQTTTYNCMKKLTIKTEMAYEKCSPDTSTMSPGTRSRALILWTPAWLRRITFAISGSYSFNASMALSAFRSCTIVCQQHTRLSWVKRKWVRFNSHSTH